MGYLIAMDECNLNTGLTYRLVITGGGHPVSNMAYFPDVVSATAPILCFKKMN